MTTIVGLRGEGLPITNWTDAPSASLWKALRRRHIGQLKGSLRRRCWAPFTLPEPRLICSLIAASSRPTICLVHSMQMRLPQHCGLTRACCGWFPKQIGHCQSSSPSSALGLPGGTGDVASPPVVMFPASSVPVASPSSLSPASAPLGLATCSVATTVQPWSGRSMRTMGPLPGQESRNAASAGDSAGENTWGRKITACWGCCEEPD